MYEPAVHPRPADQMAGVADPEWSSWRRPAPDENAEAVMMLVDIQQTHVRVDDCTYAAFNMYGTCRDGSSMFICAYGFYPYMYVQLPDAFAAADMAALDVAVEALAQKSNAGGRRHGIDRLLIGLEEVDRRSIMFYDPTPKRYAKITLATPDVLKDVREGLRKGVALPSGFVAFQPYDADILYVHRFMLDYEIVGMGWIGVPNGTCASDESSRCQRAYRVHVDDLVVHAAKDEWSGMAPLRTLSFDIECAARPKKFPHARFDPVITIAATLGTLGDGVPDRNVVFQLRSCPAVQTAETYWFDDERDMLGAFTQFINRADPDTITGYNTPFFDFPYLIERAQALGVKNFPYFGRDDAKIYVKKKKFQSKQTGTRDKPEVIMAGRVCFDMFTIVQRDQKLASYKLNAVATKFLGDQKDDLPYNIITDLFNGSDGDRHRIARYCLKDAILPLSLMRKMMSMINDVEMARVCGIPFSFVQTRGTSIRVFSKILQYARVDGYIVPYRERAKNDDDRGKKGYKGATVLEPNVGFYTDPIATLDFASLYPSIMMAHNLCFTALLAPGVEKGLVEGVDYNVSPHGHKFVTPKRCRGLLPRILEELISARNGAKALMKAETDPFRKAVYDGRQLALKVVCNTVYGVTGDHNARIPCPIIAETVTGIGRIMIETTKHYVLDNYPGSEVEYGDSVTGDTPLLVRHRSCLITDVVCIDALAAGPWRAYGDKEQADCECDAWTERGWTPIERVIRHKIGPEKRLIEVTTRAGTVCATDKHSFLNTDSTEVETRDLVPGTALLHAPLSDTSDTSDTTDNSCESNYIPYIHHIHHIHNDSYEFETDEAWLLGMMLASGGVSAENNTFTVGAKSFFSGVDNVEARVKKVFGVDCKTRYHPMLPFAYTFSAECGNEEAARYRRMCYDENDRKRVPCCIFMAAKAVQQAFIDGFQIVFEKKGAFSCEITSQLIAAGLFRVLSSIGLRATVERLQKSGADLYRIAAVENKKRGRADPHAIVKLREVKHDECFVYDLQTANHHFQAGVGDMIVHNTDSVMVKFGVKTVKEAMDLGLEAAKRITADCFKKPIRLEFEKVYKPYLLCGKKKYIGMYYTRPDKPDFMDTKGNELKRRDAFPALKIFMREVLDILMLEEDGPKAIARARHAIQTILSGKLDVAFFITTKGLSRHPDDYKGALQAHVRMAKRMMESGAGDAPVVGDRVPFVITADSKRVKITEKAEMPGTVVEKQLPIHTRYYAKIAAQALSRILEPVQKGITKTLEGMAADFVVQIPPTPGSAIANMVRPLPKCRGCGCALRAGAGGALRQQHNTARGKLPVCANCAPNAAVIHQTDVMRLVQAQYQAAEFAAKCHACQGSALRAVNCSNNECTIFYARTELQRRHDAALKDVERWQIDEW